MTREMLNKRKITNSLCSFNFSAMDSAIALFADFKSAIASENTESSTSLFKLSNTDSDVSVKESDKLSNFVHKY